MPDTPSTLRARIMDAAFTAFMRSGYEGTSTAEIARRAHVSKRDLYAHFPSKQAMLAACIMERAELMRRPLGLATPADWPHLREVLIQYGAGVVVQLGRPEVLATHRLAICSAEDATDVAQMLDQHGRAEATSGLTALLQAAVDRGLLHGADPAEMAEIFLGILNKGGMMVRMLTRVLEPPDEADATHRAVVAATCLWQLYGTPG